MSGSEPTPGTDRARMTAEQATVARSVDDVGVAGGMPVTAAASN